MPRKPKSVYTRIEEKTAQINKLKEKYLYVKQS